MINPFVIENEIRYRKEKLEKELAHQYPIPLEEELICDSVKQRKSAMGYFRLLLELIHIRTRGINA